MGSACTKAQEAPETLKYRVSQGVDDSLGKQYIAPQISFSFLHACLSPRQSEFVYKLQEKYIVFEFCALRTYATAIFALSNTCP